MKMEDRNKRLERAKERYCESMGKLGSAQEAYRCFMASQKAKYGIRADDQFGYILWTAAAAPYEIQTECELREAHDVALREAKRRKLLVRRIENTL